eukprot:15276145-Ditylum_brightwellii.AAC.1
MAQKCHAIGVPDDEHDDILEAIFFREELGYLDSTDYMKDVDISYDEYKMTLDNTMYNNKVSIQSKKFQYISSHLTMINTITK